jgi:hypothetical protein
MTPPKEDRETNSGLTVGDLIDQLKVFDRDAELYICGLHFHRLKLRGEKLLSMEFNQSIYRNSKGELVLEEFD